MTETAGKSSLLTNCRPLSTTRGEPSLIEIMACLGGGGDGGSNGGNVGGVGGNGGGGVAGAGEVGG